MVDRRRAWVTTIRSNDQGARLTRDGQTIDVIVKTFDCEGTSTRRVAYVADVEGRGGYVQRLELMTERRSNDGHCYPKKYQEVYPGVHIGLTSRKRNECSLAVDAPLYEKEPWQY